MPTKRGRSAARLTGVAGAVGVAVGVAAGFGYRAAVAPLIGWDVAARVYLTVTWWVIWPLDADSTASHAAAEDPSRAVASTVTLLAAVASLGAVAVIVSQSRSSTGVLQGVEVGVGVASVVLSWCMLHTLFTLRYARQYYRTGEEKEGGVEFEKDVRPPYSDFAYLAFTIGMTFQVSDTDLQSPYFRRLALHHALLSYLFGAVILAAVVNLIAGLVR